MMTLDLETSPQLRYVDADAPDSLFDTDWFNAKWSGEYDEGLGPEEDIEAGRPVLAATGTMPSLHPTTCHIVAASFGGMASTGNKVDVKTLRDFGDSDETCLDRVAWATDMGKPLVSFNGKGFDAWLLMVRAMLLGLPESDKTRKRIKWDKVLYPFDTYTHTDLRLVLGNSDRRARGTLAHWCEAFGVEAEESGGNVWDWVRKGDWPALYDYSVKEGHTLLNLYARVQRWI
jgi:predicted PolB exonuclease-like 3'-5' exonuclease